jgi:DNA repair protein SbcC/Rad50
MGDPRGSAWRKWDLHVHTPASLVNSYQGPSDPWESFIDALSKLPNEFKVLGINDYIFLDGYKRVLAAKEAGRLPNIDLLLPVVEVRLDKFGGSKSRLSRVNYHVIFSNTITAETIESQFLSALCSRYTLTPEFDHLRTTGRWAAVPTRQSLQDLGRMIIESVPEDRRGEFGPPLVEGFNNLCLSHDAIKDVLESHYFTGRVLTAVGKTEWADVKWNDHSIAEKKTIINGADLVFISSATPDDWERARKSLIDAGVNDRLLDCSDAHQYADAADKDRLGNCFTWIKADPTFEGLRQAVFEYPTRVQVTTNPPLEPILQVRNVRLRFPDAAELQRGETSDVFCFRGAHSLPLSPYLTCVIGGRGTGKSTLLNLMHEKLDPKSTEFFRENKLSPPGETSVDKCVSVDGIGEQRVVEFLQQNEIEQFATDHKRLTTAIFARLRKLDTEDLLRNAEADVEKTRASIETQRTRRETHHELSGRLSVAESELATQRGIVASFQDNEYQRLNGDLASRNKELQALKASKARFQALANQLTALLAQSESASVAGDSTGNAYDRRVSALIEHLRQAVDHARSDGSLEEADKREVTLGSEIKALREQMDDFLRKRGLSPESLSDVGRATERIAHLESDMKTLAARVSGVKSEIDAFVPDREAAERYVKAVESLLAPINAELKGQGSEVKPIELRYRFDMTAFSQAMIRYVADAVGRIEGRAPRPDYVESKLKELNFSGLGTLEEALERIPDDGIYGKTLREFLADGINFDLLKLEAGRRQLEVDAFGQIHVLYDDKPVENSSFGQRCTAVIVVLLLLGNTPIVIDEPEAHLDSSLIAKYLVNLIKERKKHRQIVFATHNANFVINGDAELVHCLSMDDRKVTKVVSTTIENLEHRELLLALEGGQRAFEQRERRYGMA